MMRDLTETKDQIKVGIEKAVRGEHDKWQIGITNDLEARRAEHKTKGHATKDWTWWQAKSLEDAREIENYYINEKKPGKKMKGGTGGDLENTSVFVYIFLAR